MLKFIPNDYDFELDLTYLNVTFNEVNSMFNKEFTSEYSFPFMMSIDFWSKVTNIHYNSANPITMFKGKLNRDGEITEASLKIQTHRGNDVEGIIFSGIDAFPGFENKLEELDLLNVDVVDIKTHAEQIITQDYPEVNYNFPMVHTDKYDPESDEFNGFEKIINQYNAGHFITNVLEPETNIDVIKNILQPFPYLLYVLKKGFEKVGYTLAGDILDDNDLKTCLIFRDGNYYDSLSKEVIPFRIKNDEHLGVNNIKSGKEHVIFEKEIEITKKGDYILFGQIMSLAYWGIDGLMPVIRTDLSITLSKETISSSSILFQSNINGNSGSISGHKVTIKNIDIELSLNAGDKIKIIKIEPRRDQQPESETPEYPETVSLDLIPIRYRYPDGSPIISLLWLNKIDLKKCVPDITFGEVIEQIRLLKNYDFITKDNIVFMNKISLSSREGAIDISKSDIEEPLRTFNDERSYEIKFADGDNPTYKYDSLFIDKNGVKTNVYKINKNTSEISIDVLPYPVITRNGVTTAHAFDDESSKLRLIFFRSPNYEELPICYNNSNVLIPAVYASNYFHWLNFLLNSVRYEWDFIIPVEIWKDVNIRSLIFAYHNYHLFTDLEKERIVIGMEHYYRITARSESLV